MALLGLVVTVALPMVNFSSKWELQAAAQQMAGDMRLARQEAIVDNSYSKIDFYIHSRCYRMVLTEGSRCVDLPPEVDYEGKTTFSGEPPSVYFYSLGHPNRGGTVILKTKDEKHKLYVILSPITGRVRISEKQPEHW